MLIFVFGFLLNTNFVKANIWCYSSNDNSCIESASTDEDCSLYDSLYTTSDDCNSSNGSDNKIVSLKWCLTTQNTCIQESPYICTPSYDTQQACITAINQKNASANSNTNASSPGCPQGSVCLSNPIGTTSITEIFGNAIKVVTGILGSLALLVFVYGGFLWLTSAGSQEKIKKGTSAMVWAVIGIIVIFASYAIISLVLGGIGVKDFVPSTYSPTTNNTSANNPTATGSEPTTCHCDVKLTGRCVGSSVLDIGLGKSYGITELKSAIGTSQDLDMTCRIAINSFLSSSSYSQPPVVFNKQTCLEANKSGSGTMPIYGDFTYAINCQLK